MDEWLYAQAYQSISYRCGYCDNLVASSSGWDTVSHKRQVRICPHCGQASYFDHRGIAFPGASIGSPVQHLPKDVEQLYTEARATVSVNAYTAAVLVARKILMHVAVEKGAEPSRSFVEYVEFLQAKNYIPEGGRAWVDEIRKRGNEANHTIVVMSRQDAEQLLRVLEMLLRIVYEFPNLYPAPAVTP